MNNIKLKLYINIVLGLLIYGSSFAQGNDDVWKPKAPFEPLTIEGIVPLTHNVLHDDTFRKFGSDGYNCFQGQRYIDKLQYKNYYIAVYGNITDGETIYDNQFYGNYHIVCFNLDNGEIAWHNKVFLSSYPNPEIPRLMEVDDDGILHIYGQVREFVDSELQYYYNLILFERQYDLKTGAFISLSHKAFDDPDAYHTFYSELFPSTFIKQDDGDFRILERFDTAEDVGYKSYSLNVQGALTSGPDTVLYEYFNDFVGSFNIKEVGRDSLLLLEIDIDDEGDEVIILRYLTYDLKPLDEVVIKSPFIDNLWYLHFGDISPDKDKILLSVWQDVGDYIQFIVIDKQGHILKQMKQTLRFLSTGDVFNWWSEGEYSYSRNIELLYFRDTKAIDKNEILFYKIGDNFQDTIIKVITIEDPLRYGSVQDLLRYNDKEIVIMKEGALYYENDRYYLDDVASAISIMTFNKGDFSPPDVPIRTSVKDYQDDKSRIALKAYPNPSTGQLTIDLQGINTEVDIRVFDMTGRNVFVQDDAVGETTLDLSALSDGTYVYKIYQSGREISSGKWVKVR